MREAVVWIGEPEEENEVEGFLVRSGIQKARFTQSWEELRRDAKGADVVVFVPPSSFEDAFIPSLAQFMEWLRGNETTYRKYVLLLYSKERECFQREELVGLGVDQFYFVSSWDGKLDWNRSSLQKGRWTCLGYIKPFVEATKRIFERVGVELESGRPRYLKEVDCFHRAVTGVVSFSKGSYGSLMLHVEEEIGKRMIKLLFSLSEVGHDELVDGLGEVVNMIGGNAKRELGRQYGISFQLSLPNVIVGRNYRVFPPFEGAVSVNLRSEKGISFLLSVALRREYGTEREKGETAEL